MTVPLTPPRRLPSDNGKFEDISPPFSNFSYVDDFYKGHAATRRLFSQARSLGACTLLTEELPVDGLVRDENEEITALFPDYSMEFLRRLSFWDCSPRAVQSKKADSTNLLGFAVMKCDRVGMETAWHIFESVFRKHPHEHNYVPRIPKFRVLLGGGVFRLPGVLYCQQNGLNKACAQVALRSAIASCRSQRDISYRRINELAAAIKPFHPKDGLDSQQIRHVLEQLDITYTDVDYTTQTDTFREELPYQKFLYAGIESGDAALLGFEFMGPGATGQRHIIPFFGHTFNKDTWVPYAEHDYFHVGDETRYIPSEAWVSSFIGHDDNFGSNFCVPRQYVQRGQVQYVVVIHRSGFASNGVEAEAVAIEYLYSLLASLLEEGLNNEWTLRLAKNAAEQRVVLRAIPLTRDEYVKHLSTVTDWKGKNEYKYLREALGPALPDCLWMIEVSIPELFPANKRKIGCILLDGSKPMGPELDFSSFLLARFPGLYLFFRSINEDGHPQFEGRMSNLKSHVDLLARH